MSSEDTLFEVYDEVQKSGLREDFDKQIKKMSGQDKHRYKTIAEKWEYALYRIKGGKKIEKF